MLSMCLSDDSTVNVGLAVGLTLGLFFGVFFLALPICIGVAIYCRAKKRVRNTRTRIVTTTPSTGPSVVTSTRDTSFTNTPNVYPYPRQPYPTQFTPAPYSAQLTAAPYPTQPQPDYQDAQFSYEEAPPSYNAALSFPPYTAPVTVSHYLAVNVMLAAAVNERQRKTTWPLCMSKYLE